LDGWSLIGLCGTAGAWLAWNQINMDEMNGRAQQIGAGVGA